MFILALTNLSVRTNLSVPPTGVPLPPLLARARSVGPAIWCAVLQPGGCLNNLSGTDVCTLLRLISGDGRQRGDVESREVMGDKTNSLGRTDRLDRTDRADRADKIDRTSLPDAILQTWLPLAIAAWTASRTDFLSNYGKAGVGVGAVPPDQTKQTRGDKRRKEQTRVDTSRQKETKEAWLGVSLPRDIAMVLQCCLPLSSLAALPAARFAEWTQAWSGDEDIGGESSEGQQGRGAHADGGANNEARRACAAAVFDEALMVFWAFRGGMDD